MSCSFRHNTNRTNGLPSETSNRVYSSIKNEVFGKYLYFKTRSTKDSGFLKILESLFCEHRFIEGNKFRKPNPPAFFGAYNFSHPTQWIFFYSSKETSAQCFNFVYDAQR